jgi:hypothetical protein
MRLLSPIETGQTGNKYLGWKGAVIDMNPLKQRSKSPELVTLLMVGLIMVFGDTQHLCYLQSTIVEIPLLLGVVLASYLWTARAKTSGLAWRRMGLSFLLAIAIEMIYLFWLHSDFFPRALLSPRAKQRQAVLSTRRQTDQSPEGDIRNGSP